MHAGNLHNIVQHKIVQMTLFGKLGQHLNKFEQILE